VKFSELAHLFKDAPNPNHSPIFNNGINAGQGWAVMAILRIESVKAEFGHRSNTSIHQRVRDGLFTKPVAIGQRAVGWPDSEVKAIARAHIAGRTEDEIRDLVKRLHEQRTALADEAFPPSVNEAVAPPAPAKTKAPESARLAWAAARAAA
jgi:prophage regulatory protein